MSPKSFGARVPALMKRRQAQLAANRKKICAGTRYPGAARTRQAECSDRSESQQNGRNSLYIAHLPGSECRRDALIITPGDFSQRRKEPQSRENSLTCNYRLQDRASVLICKGATRNLQLSTFNLQPSTFNLQLATCNLQPITGS